MLRKRKCEININNRILIFLLGIFANMSVIQIFGNTVHFYLMYGIVIFSIILQNKVIIKNKVYLTYSIIELLSTFLCFISNMFSSAWEKKVLISCLNIWICFLCYNVVASKFEYISCYIKGVYIGCLIQLIWCYLQLIGFYIFHIDLNKLVFGAASAYKKGNLVLSGLSVHAGTLVPIFVCGFLMSKNKIIKCLFLLMGLINNNATTMIAMLICVLGYVFLEILFNRRKYLAKIDAKNVFVFAIVIVLIIAIYNSFDLGNTISTVYERIYSVIIDRKMTSGSDAVHFRYLTSIPYILSRFNLINLLFGYGHGTSGFQMTRFFGQYSDKIWVIESDFVNILYSVGIVGTVVFYYMLIYIMLKGMRIDKRYAIFSLVVIGAGIFYNFQLSWLIMLEFLMHYCIKNNENCWEIPVNYRK